MKTEQQPKSIFSFLDKLIFFFAKPAFKIAQKRGINDKELERFLRFMVVGTIGFVVDFGILNLLVLLFDLDVLVANTISFTSAVLSNFTWNRIWTYPDSRSKDIRAQLVQFFMVNIIGWGINTFVLWSLTPIFTELVGRLGYNIAKAIATIIVLFWNFFVNRYWTYNDVD